MSKQGPQKEVNSLKQQEANAPEIHATQETIEKEIDISDAKSSANQDAKVSAALRNSGQRNHTGSEGSERSTVLFASSDSGEMQGPLI